MYHYKYLKYKTKYLNLKNIKGGLPLIINEKDIENINQFKDENIEKYFNPIYGLCFYKTYFISNI